MLGWTREDITRRAAQDIQDGWAVNLGIGLPTRIADYIPVDREVLLHSENGILGMGKAAQIGAEDHWIVNAGKQYITLQPGASIFHHVDSFIMIRGGHLDLCVMGAYQVAQNGDLANWSAGDAIPGVGGAMDLARGARQIWIVTDHVTKKGEPKLKARCSYALTAPGCVRMIFTNLGVFAPAGDAFVVHELAPGVMLEDVRRATDADVLPREAEAAAL